MLLFGKATAAILTPFLRKGIFQQQKRSLVAVPVCLNLFPASTSPVEEKERYHNRHRHHHRQQVRPFGGAIVLTTPSRQQIPSSSTSSTTTVLHSSMSSTSSSIQDQYCKYQVIDSFADIQKPGSGNPAAVVLLPQTKTNFDPSDSQNIKWMQIVAKEFNLSETAFCWPRTNTKNNGGDGILEYNIRYYSGGGQEVDLCGHATLASAAVLLSKSSSMSMSQQQEQKDASITFHAKNDVILQAKPFYGKDENENENENDNNNNLAIPILMDFPTKSVQEVTDSKNQSGIQDMLQKALDLDPSNIIFLGLEEDNVDLLVHVTPAALHKIPYDDALDIGALTTYPDYHRGVMICCLAEDNENAGGNIDFQSRWFGPKAGINEDPVTGSAHCTMAPYFASLLNFNSVRGQQLSSRGGIVDCTLTKNDRVQIVGTAVTTMGGTLYL